MKHQRIKMIDGVRYYASRPENCKDCLFWKNRKVGCILGTEHCYYLAEIVMSDQEKKCQGCCYAVGGPCVSASCYQELEQWLRERHRQTPRSKDADHHA